MPDVSQGQMTSLNVPKNPIRPQGGGFLSRVKSATSYLISGVTPQTWFGPMQPLEPMAPPDVMGRRFDYPTGYNLNYEPRGYETYGFRDLRAMADNCDMMRAIIEGRKDQLAGDEWVIRPRQALSASAGAKQIQDTKINLNSSIGSATPDQRERIVAISTFFESPDQELDWDQWQRELLEELFVIDAPSMYRRKTRGGAPYAFEILDGATIKPLLNADGRRPRAPDPAYQQILHGIPAVDFSSDELYYWPRNTRAHKVYGFPPVEQVLVTVNTAIRRSLFQLDYYLAGSQPDAFMGCPPDWSLKNIKEFQEYMDSMLSGKMGERRKLRYVPGEFKYQETKQPPLSDQYDEWLARIICFAFQTDPAPFITKQNKSGSETSKAKALEEGRGPLQAWVKTKMDRILKYDFRSPDLEFMYVDDREQDPLTQMQIDTGNVVNGLSSINEVRALRGRPVVPGVADQLMIKTAVGYVPVGILAPTGNANTAPANKHEGGSLDDVSDTSSDQSKPKNSNASNTSNVSAE